MGNLKKATKVASQNKRNASIAKVLGACIFICVIFCAGFLVRGNAELLSMMGLASLGVDTEVNPGQTVTGNTHDSISARVAEMEGILNQDGVGSYDLDKTTEEVLSAFTQATGDPFLRYYDEKSYQAYLASTTNPEAGVGVLFGEDGNTVYAADVFEDSSAAAAGVQAGDRIESINGVSSDSWSIPDVLRAFEETDGKTVYVSWRRPSSTSGEKDEVLSTNLVYSSSTEKNVTSTLDDEVAVIKVKQITSDSSSLVSHAVTKAIEKGAQAFVLDLRDVPGGYLTQAVEIAALFIPSGTVVQIETVDATTTRSADGESITAAPLVVLVNGRTAGCAEVLAVALQETGRAEVVGTQTQGKGSVQAMQPLSFGGALRYTAAYYLTPQGLQIDKKGVSPDVEVSSSSSQTKVALDVARSQIS